MSALAVITALALPPDARVDQRVPKKLLVEQGAPTTADKRQIQDGIDELMWIAALKPSNIGVADYRDEVREYLEIAVLTAKLRSTAKAARLTELIHRAIPYPLFLVTTHGETTSLSLAHKRFGQNEARTTVLDGTVITSSPFGVGVAPAFHEPEKNFLESLPLAGLSRVHLCAIYQGWIDRVEALHAARITGRFVLAPTSDVAADRRAALGAYGRVQREITGLRAQAEKEKQINRRVDLNLDIKRLEVELVAIVNML